MTDARLLEVPLPTVLDRHGVDRLLGQLRAKHGEAGRSDIAPEIARAIRMAARLAESAAERVPVG